MQDTVIYCLFLWSMSQHALDHWVLKTSLKRLAPESLIFHPLECMHLTKVSSILITSSSCSLTIITWISWTGMIFRGMSTSLWTMTEGRRVNTALREKFKWILCPSMWMQIVSDPLSWLGLNKIYTFTRLMTVFLVPGPTLMFFYQLYQAWHSSYNLQSWLTLW